MIGAVRGAGFPRLYQPDDALDDHLRLILRVDAGNHADRRALASSLQRFFSRRAGLRLMTVLAALRIPVRGAIVLIQGHDLGSRPVIGKFQDIRRQGAAPTID